MDRLKGKFILIGKEERLGRLLVCVSINGKMCATTVGRAGFVPSSVSRCLPAEEKAHCRIDIDQNGAMKLTNLKPQNVTYVNGMEIRSKCIDTDSVVALGKDLFEIDMQSIMDTVLKMMDKIIPPTPLEFDITHLEQVWEEYEQSIEAIQKNQQQRARRRLLPIMLSSVSGLAVPLFATLVSASTLYVTVPIAAVSFLLYILIYREKDTSIEERKEAGNLLIERYVCPNDDRCGHFLGFQPYKVLRQNKRCPYCGCYWKS